MRLYLLAILTVILTSCGVSRVQSDSFPISHQLFDSLLQKHVTEAGWVDYQGIQRDSVQFNQYLQLLQDNHPNKKNWSPDEQLAYWINAYNAFTIDLILQHYPVKSIKDIKDGTAFINSVWDIKFITIEGEEYDLNNIEHGIIRKRYDEPRIHFAVNCASYSCPRLRNEAYVAERLDQQLEEQARIFFNDPRKNNIERPDKISISPLLSWYSPDFTDKGFLSRFFGKKKRLQKLAAYADQYVDIDVNKKPTVEFMEYRWDLNDTALQTEDAADVAAGK